MAYVRLVWGFNHSVYALLARVRPIFIHVSDIEALPAALLYARRRGVPLLYNIHDNLSQRYRLPGFVRVLLNSIEGAAILLSDCTVVPEPYRRSALPAWTHAHVRTVRNTPEDPGFVRPARVGSQRISLFYGGWVDSGRGLDILLRLLELVPEMDLRVAGEGSEDLVERLSAHPRVEYLGFVDHRRVMDETAACHFVPALYDPRRIINRFAAPNKMAEAFAVGRPIVVNSELAIVDQLSHPPCLVTAPYGDVEMLARGIRRLWGSPRDYEAACWTARRIYERDYSWNSASAAAHAALDHAMGAPHDAS